MGDFYITLMVDMIRSALDILKSVALRTEMQCLMEEVQALEHLILTDTVQAKSRTGDQEVTKWLAAASNVALVAWNSLEMLINELEMKKLKERRGEIQLGFWSIRAPVFSLLCSPIFNWVTIRRIRRLSTEFSQIRQRYPPSVETAGTHPNDQEPQNQIEEVVENDASTADDGSGTVDALNGVLLNASISRRCVLAISGVRGIGKTTLGQQLYHNVQTVAQFESQAWVTINQDSTAVSSIIRILKQVMLVTKHELEGLERDELIKKLNQTLKQKRYLIVLDDVVWKYDYKWKEIVSALPDSNNGSRLLLISRLSPPSDLKVPIDVFYTVPPLSHQQGWELFVRNAFPLSSSACPDHLQGISREFVRICGGHPHSLKLAGALVSTRSPNVTEWTQVLHTVTAALNGWHFYDKSLRLPALYYTNLSDNRLKSCFLSLLCFPKHAGIESSQMIGVWMALGFIPPPQNGDVDTTTMEDRAGVYLTELVRQSMLRVVKMDHDGRALTCQVDPQFHDLFEEPHYYHSRRRFLFRQGKLPFEWNLDIKYDICAHYLGLTSSSGITKLPSWIGYLPYLQTLDIRKTGITQLPSSLGEATTLRHLFMSDCEFCAPIARLTNLQTMTFVNDRGGYVERDLARLSSIRVLGITVEAEDLTLFFSALDNLNHIFSLYLQSKMPISILELSKAQIKLPDQLQKLYLQGRVTQGLPFEPFFPKNLIVLTLDGSKLDQDPMKELGELPKLQHLTLKNDAFVGNDMESLPGGFPRLRSLHLQCLRDLINLRVGEGSMSSLISLSIVLCDGIPMLPDGVQHLTSLLELEVIDPRDDFLRRLQQEGDDWHKISHVASIKLNPRTEYDYTNLKKRSPYRVEVDRF